MQKVSKQSLAMIALSILLAISIALTFTFAALSAEKQATGTITFDKAYGLTLNTNADSYTFVVNFTSEDQTKAKGQATSEGTEWDEATIGIAATSSACNIKITIEFDVEGDDAGETKVKNALAKYITVPSMPISDVTVGGTRKLNTIITFNDLSLENDDFATLTNTTATKMTATVKFAAIAK